MTEQDNKGKPRLKGIILAEETLVRRCPNCLFYLTKNGKCPDYFGRCGWVQKGQR